jgi:putative transposase
MRNRIGGFLSRSSPRLKSIDYNEPYPFLLTTCTHARKHIFANREFSSVVVEALAEYSPKYDMQLFAYCLMPDHLHILARPEGVFPITRYIKSIKGKTTFKLHKLGFQGSVWQRSFNDHAVRVSEDLNTIIKYILENPVRSGLVSIFYHYEWSWDCYRIKGKAAKEG